MTNAPHWFDAPLGSKQWAVSYSKTKFPPASLSNPFEVPLLWDSQAMLVVPDGYLAVVAHIQVMATDPTGLIWLDVSYSLELGGRLELLNMPAGGTFSPCCGGEVQATQRMEMRPVPVLVPLVANAGETGRLLVKHGSTNRFSLFVVVSGWLQPVTLNVPGARKYQTERSAR